MHQFAIAFQSDLTNLGKGPRDKRGPCSDLDISAVRLDALSTFLRIFFVSRKRLWQLISSDHAVQRGATRKYFRSVNHTNLTGPALNITKGFAGLRRLALCQARVGATTRATRRIARHAHSHYKTRNTTAWWAQARLLAGPPLRSAVAGSVAGSAR